MSSATLSPSAEQSGRMHTARPSFWGTFTGELFKVARMWSTWITLILLLGAVCFPYLVEIATNVQDRINAGALNFYYQMMEINLSVIRIFIGFFLIILTANVIGREYQLGTIRVLLARGVGRLQLLGAKLLAIVVFAVVVGLFCLLLSVLLFGALILIKMGNFDTLKVLTPDFWHNTWLYLLTVPISMLATILMAMAMTVLGHSLVFGLSAGMSWFPADNIVTPLLGLVYVATKASFWNDITAYFLGPNLNVMPVAFIPATKFFHPQELGQPPNVLVDAQHTLLVTLAYSIAFILIAALITWKRDVKE